MKKLLSMFMVAAMLAAMVGCTQPQAETNENAENVGGVNDAAVTDSDATADNEDAELAEILAMVGMSEEEFAAMEPEQQQSLLAELNAYLEYEKNRKEQAAQQTEPAKTYTPEDVMAGGSYKVVLGDYMNSITLYYQDGKLVKLEEAFQKSSEEEGEFYTVEGDALAEYSFNFVDWANAPLQEILDGMKDYGGFGQYEIVAVE